MCVLRAGRAPIHRGHSSPSPSTHATRGTPATRHARATQVQIWLGCVGDQLVVRIEDDGCGLEQGSVWGIGMHSMHERARCLGAVLQLRSAEQGGLILELSIPWRQAA